MPVDQAQVGTLMRLLLVVRALARQTETLLGGVAAERDCSAADCLLLWELAGLAGHVGHRRPSDLATACGLASSTVASRLTRLEAAGLVTRGRESGDRRAVVIQPTRAGAHLARETFDGFALCAAGLLRAADSELAGLVDLYARAREPDASGSGRFGDGGGGNLHSTTASTEEEP